jgi:hypothetical protein
VDNVPATLSFNSYLGAGFAPSPTADQLDSDGIVVTGVSDELTPMHFGHTADTGDYARGPVVGGTTVGGIYAFDVGGGNPALGFQPSVGDMTPGQIYFAYRNQTGGPITSIRLEHLVHVYNGGDRVTGLRVRYAQETTPVTDPSAVVFSDVAGSDFVSPGAADPAPTWIANSYDLTISSLTIPDGGCFYLSFSTVSPVGSGDWDGFALDDIKVRANPVTGTDVEDTPMFASGQSHLMSNVYPNPFNPRASCRHSRNMSLISMDGSWPARSTLSGSRVSHSPKRRGPC